MFRWYSKLPRRAQHLFQAPKQFSNLRFSILNNPPTAKTPTLKSAKTPLYFSRLFSPPSPLGGRTAKSLGNPVSKFLISPFFADFFAYIFYFIIFLALIYHPKLYNLLISSLVNVRL